MYYRFLFLVVLLFVVGCTSQPATQPQPTSMPGSTGGNSVDVKLTEFKIDMPNSLPAGTTTFKVTNDGKVVHNVEIVGNGIDKKLDANLQAGQSGTMQVDLKPGTYDVYCPVDSHKQNGMDLQLTVK